MDVLEKRTPVPIMKKAPRRRVVTEEEEFIEPFHFGRQYEEGEDPMPQFNYLSPGLIPKAEESDDPSLCPAKDAPRELRTSSSLHSCSSASGSPSPLPHPLTPPLPHAGQASDSDTSVCSDSEFVDVPLDDEDNDDGVDSRDHNLNSSYGANIRIIDDESDVDGNVDSITNLVDNIDNIASVDGDDGDRDDNSESHVSSSSSAEALALLPPTAFASPEGDPSFGVDTACHVSLSDYDALGTAPFSSIGLHALPLRIDAALRGSPSPDDASVLASSSAAASLSPKLGVALSEVATYSPTIDSVTIFPTGLIPTIVDPDALPDASGGIGGVLKPPDRRTTSTSQDDTSGNRDGVFSSISAALASRRKVSTCCITAWM